MSGPNDRNDVSPSLTSSPALLGNPSNPSLLIDRDAKPAWFKDAVRRVLSIHWSPYDRVRVVNADP